MKYTNIVQQYSEHGMICIPTKADKSPAMSSGWKDGFPIEAFENCEGIGLICGKKSGGVECFDFDNHAGDAIVNIKKFIEIPEVNEIYLKHLIPIEQTLSGGFHFIFRCKKNDGNRKLASKLLNGKPDCFIETRGEGGYFCIAPTPGYKVIKNDICKIPLITEIERAILFDNAISLNEIYPQLIKTEYEQTDRPGDVYNSQISSISEMKSILQNAGWKDLGGHKWRRPGKKEGISATIGKVAPNVLYVFTSNAYPFENNKAYTPFQVLGLVKFGGDFNAAAKSITPDQPSKQEPSKLQPSEIEKILLGSLIDTRITVEKPPTILSIREQDGTRFEYRRVFTLGNFSCIIGKAKSKKTFLMSMFTAALLANETGGKFIAEMRSDKRNILYFDTEQGEYDAYNVIKRIEQMANSRVNMKAFNLRPFSPIERCQIIEYAFKLYGDKTGYCVIDGIADLANGINDEDEATRVVTILLRLSKVYNCHISTVIHQNKNDGFATGHLGSSVMKKAEIIISVTKSEGNTSDVKCDMSRGIAFEDFTIIIDQNGIPYTSDSKPKPKSSFYETEYKSVDEIPWD